MRKKLTEKRIGNDSAERETENTEAREQRFSKCHACLPREAPNWLSGGSGSEII